MKQYYGHVCNCLRRSGFDYLHEKFGIVVSLAQVAHSFVFQTSGLPLPMASCSQIIFVILKKFLQTRFGYIDEFDFRLCGGGGGGTALHDVLFSTSCGLHHLVDGAISFAEVFPAKVICHAVYGVSLLIADQRLIVAFLLD